MSWRRSFHPSLPTLSKGWWQLKNQGISDAICVKDLLGTFLSSQTHSEECEFHTTRSSFGVKSKYWQNQKVVGGIPDVVVPTTVDEVEAEDEVTKNP